MTRSTKKAGLPAAVQALLVVVFMLFAARITSLVLVYGPYLLHNVRHASTQSTCAKIRPGMTLSQAETLVHAHSEPLQESLTGRDLFFGEWTLCHVEFEPQTRNVTKAYMGLGAEAQ